MKQINIVEDLHRGIDLKELAQKTNETVNNTKGEENNDNNERHGE